MYHVYLGEMELPVAPKKISTKIKNQNKTVTLVNEGEVNLLKKAGLTDISFTMMIPHYNVPFARDLRGVDYYLSALELLKVKRMPFQFIVTRGGTTSYTTNMTVSLEDYSIDEDADDGPITSIQVQLKKYGDYGDVKAKIQEKVVGGKTVLTVQKETQRLDTRDKPKQVTAQTGDTLWKIAKKHLGDGSKYRELARINNLENPNGILAGQVIRLE